VKPSTGETNYRFNLFDWVDQFPLEMIHNHYDGEIITSPSHLCNNERLRREMQGEYDWGEPVPVDVFVMAEGEPRDRHVTKLGGLPYRPANAPWPVARDGKPMLFLGQFNFGDSRDLVGELPGDVLLVFSDRSNEVFDRLIFEWQPMGLEDLIPATSVPVQPDTFTPCYGHVCRTVNFPSAKQRRDARYPLCRGRDVWSAYFVPKYQATQIGSAPFIIQRGTKLPGRIICTISSVQPDPHAPFPWVNHPDPLLPPGEYDFNRNDLMLDDMGCIYISIDDQQQLHWSMDSY